MSKIKSKNFIIEADAFKTTINRGVLPSATFEWDETSQSWMHGLVGSEIKKLYGGVS